MNDQKISQLESILPEIAKQCSERERMADEAERETEDLKKVEYMKAHEGEIFEGIISNVTNFGMFIEMENTIEGLVRMSSMEDDYYNYDERHFCLIGERTHKTYRIGDEVKVILAKADVATKKIEFVLVETKEGSELKKLEGAASEDFSFSRPKKTKSSFGNKKPASNGDRSSKKNSSKQSARKGKAIDQKVLDKITGKGKRKKKKEGYGS
jgi:ribonuclease R